MFVLSEKNCSMLLFPFINSKNDDLVECVVLPEIPIWVSKKAEEGALLNRQLLVVILLFCAGRDEGENINYMDYKYEYPADLGAGTKKSVIKAKIQSVVENLMDLLTKEREEKEKEREEKEKEKKEKEKANEEIKKLNEEKEEMLATIKELQRGLEPEPKV